MKTLVVFDFDHTVIDDNSDTWVIRCLPGQTLPESLKNSYRRGYWTEFMGRVMSYIGEQQVRPDSVRSVMESVPFTAGMAELLAFITAHKSSVDCIIISDSNTLFIEWILAAAGVQAAVDRVFTNPAEFDESGCMEVRCYHSHHCARCPVNLCKKAVLEAYLSERAQGGEEEYRRMFYVGDGGNDLCPASCLRASDVVMPRKGYTLEKLLAKLEGQEDETSSVRARVIAWSSGSEILEELKASMQAS